VSRPRRVVPRLADSPYRSHRRPAFGRDDRSIGTRLVTLHPDDGHEWDGLLLRPRHGDPALRKLLVIVVHGSVGNYLTGVPRRVAFDLASMGFSVMSINTRLANYGPFFGGGLFHKTPLDLLAAMDVARAHGFTRVALLGYSMGCTVCTNFLANHDVPEAVGLCTIAHPESLPEALRLRWQRYGSTPTYDEVAEYARPIVADHPDDPPGDRIFTVMRANGPLPTPENGEIWTYATWWSSRGPESPHAVSRDQIGKVRVPIAILQAGNDHLIQPGEGYELAHVAELAGNHDVFLDMVPHADHVFTGCIDDVSDMAGRWLAELT